MVILILYGLILLAAIIHVLEEYYTGWLDYAQKYAKNVKKVDFIVINIIFVIIVFISTLLVILTQTQTIFNLAVVFLIFINALIHIIPSIVLRRYIPGLISALIGYLPVSIWIIGYDYVSKQFNLMEIFISLIIGLLLMALPFIYQAVFKKNTIKIMLK